MRLRMRCWDAPISTRKPYSWWRSLQTFKTSSFQCHHAKLSKHPQDLEFSPNLTVSSDWMMLSFFAYSMRRPSRQVSPSLTTSSARLPHRLPWGQASLVVPSAHPVRCLLAAASAVFSNCWMKSTELAMVGRSWHCSHPPQPRLDQRLRQRCSTHTWRYHQCRLNEKLNKN